jgi:hypothetical protein
MFVPEAERTGDVRAFVAENFAEDFHKDSMTLLITGIISGMCSTSGCLCRDVIIFPVLLAHHVRGLPI